ncbi:MAG: MFS transporter [Anaerolineae bacterium]|nr:MFS transporter [Anaerolineae bacterium]
MFKNDKMFPRFALYGFLKNLRFFEPFMVLFFVEQGMSFLQIGILYAIRDIATNLLEIPAGVYADAFGRRQSMLISFGSYILSFIIFFAFPNPYIYSLAMIIFALGEAFRTGTHKALILEHLKLNDMSHLKVAYYGRTRASSQLGSALNSILAAGLVFYSGSYRYIFIASIVPYVLDFVNLASYPKELDGELAQLQRGAISTQIRTTLHTFGAMFKDHGALRAILNSSGFDAFFKSTKGYLQPILESFALALPLFTVLEDTRRSAIIIGAVTFIMYLMTSYASRNAQGFSERFDNIVCAINITFFLGAICLLIAGIATWTHISFVSILIFIVFYLLQNVRRPMNVSFISDQISNKVMASGLSVESQVTTVLMALLAPILGAIADAYGVGTALVIFGILMAIFGLLANVKHHQRRTVDDSATA